MNRAKSLKFPLQNNSIHHLFYAEAGSRLERIEIQFWRFFIQLATYLRTSREDSPVCQESSDSPVNTKGWQKYLLVSALSLFLGLLLGYHSEQLF